MHTSNSPSLFPAQKFTQSPAASPFTFPRAESGVPRFSRLSLVITGTIVGLQALMTVLHFL